MDNPVNNPLAYIGTYLRIDADNRLSIDVRAMIQDFPFAFAAGRALTPDITPLMVPRSGKWPRLERIHLAEHPECEVCGTRELCVGHHVLPVHLFPEHELDPDNIITLCNSRWHHITFGHFMNWRGYNRDVRQHALVWKKLIETRPMAAPVGIEVSRRVADVLVENEAKCDALFLAHPEIL